VMASALIIPAQSAPTMVSQPAVASTTILVEGGCGRDFHRGEDGRCHPNWREWDHRACEPGWHLRDGRCWPN
jgi:hypothetical protein